MDREFAAFLDYDARFGYRIGAGDRHMNTRPVVLTVFVAVCGCTARTGAPAGTRITVQEFVIPRDVVVQRYGGDYQGLGMKYAQVAGSSPRSPWLARRNGIPSAFRSRHMGMSA
jgi:hypothetical protein